MKALLLAVACLLAACSTSTPPGSETTGAPDIIVWHDDQRAVTCWLSHVAYGYRDISCLPDSVVRR